MRILAVHPGAPFSTQDVYSGMTQALKRLGHDVQEYRLDLRMQDAHDFLQYRQRQNRKINRSLPKRPDMDAVVRLASMTLLEAALTVNPHFVLIFSGMFLHPDTIRLMARMGAPMAGILTESPYDDARQSNITPFFEETFTNERGSVRLMQRWYEQYNGERGAKSIHYLPHAYDPYVHTLEDEIGDEADSELMRREHDVVFVGSGFIERQEVLEAIDWEAMGIDLGLYGPWPYLNSRSKLRKFWRGKVIPNRVTAALYRNAKVGLNLYRESVGTSRNATRIKGAESLNPRALELAATGCLQISSYRPEVEEVFGSLVPTFISPEELADHVCTVLNDYTPEGAKEQGRQLRAAVQGWTFDERAKQITDILERAVAARKQK